VTVRLDVDAGPDTPPYDHPLITGENAAALIFSLICSSSKAANRLKPTSLGMTSS
jgi:hypothetical protein